MINVSKSVYASSDHLKCNRYVNKAKHSANNLFRYKIIFGNYLQHDNTYFETVISLEFK